MSQQLNSSEVSSLLYAECRALQFKAMKWAEEQTSGNYRSLSKGSGMEFDEARLYVPGDDSRRIDWKLTARKSSTYVKSFIEERDNAVSLLIDLSASTILGTRNSLLERTLEVSAFLSSIALFNKDIISAILFDQIIKDRIKPSKKATSVFRILHSIIEATQSPSSPNPNQSSGQASSFEIILEEACHFLKRRNLVFIISDFKYPTSFHSILKYLANKHEIYALWLEDDLSILTKVQRLAKVYNPETGKQAICDLSSKDTINKIIHARSTHDSSVVELFNTCGVRFTKIKETDETKDILSNFIMGEARKRRSR